MLLLLRHNGADSPVTVKKLPTGTLWPGFGVFIRKYANDEDVKIDANSIIIGNIASIKVIFC